jgi:hypothetical protein
MDARQPLWQVLDRLTGFIPGPPTQRPDVRSVPDPDDPRVSPETRRARRQLWRQKHEKAGKGGYR